MQTIPGRRTRALALLLATTAGVAAGCDRRVTDPALPSTTGPSISPNTGPNTSSDTSPDTSPGQPSTPPAPVRGTAAESSGSAASR